MRLLNSHILLLYDRTNLGRKVVFQGLTILGYRGVFAPFAFRQNRVFAPARNRRFQIDPRTVEHTGCAARLLHFLSHTSHEVLQFIHKPAPLHGKFLEQRLQGRIFHILSRCAKTMLPVFARFDEGVENRRDGFRSNSHTNVPIAPGDLSGVRIPPERIQCATIHPRAERNRSLN
jgi:hypothetical protein